MFKILIEGPLSFVRWQWDVSECTIVLSYDFTYSADSFAKAHSFNSHVCTFVYWHWSWLEVHQQRRPKWLVKWTSVPRYSLRPPKHNWWLSVDIIAPLNHRLDTNIVSRYVPKYKHIWRRKNAKCVTTKACAIYSSTFM